MGLQIIGEEKSPRLICGRCKKVFTIDIRPFQKDASRLAKYQCTHCRTEVFAGILILGNTNFEALLDQITAVIQLFKDNKGSVESLGRPGSNTKPTLQ